jgi:hypothetical protein
LDIKFNLSIQSIKGEALLVMNITTYILTLSALIVTIACTDPSVSDTQITEKGIVKGRVVDEKGNPVANAEIIANSTDYYNKTSTGYTDASGNYRFRLPTGVAEGSYSVEGTVTMKYHNRNYKMSLFNENARVFSAYDGAVRNFTFRLTGKRTGDADDNDRPLGARLEVHHQVDNVVLENLEITLEPVGPLVDASTGKKLIFVMQQNQYFIDDIPLGKYKITARDKANGVHLGVAIHGKFDGYKSSVTGIFDDDTMPGSTLYDLVILVDRL